MNLFRILAALALLATAACAHAVGRLADVQVRDGGGRPLPVYWHEGRAYVVGRPGDEYRVVVHNRAGEDLLAVVSVDGVNVLSGETASAEQGGYVVGPWRRVEIRGWRKSLDDVAAFYFTSLGDSYAARTGRPANVGVIGVALFRRAQAPLPDRVLQPFVTQPRAESSFDELQAKRAQGAPPLPSAPLGTGHGRREDSPVRYVDFERASSQPEETVAIYYDSRANLVAQGVIPPMAPRAWPHTPDPFPAAFVPDPR